MFVFGVRKEYSDVTTPKTSISASADIYLKKNYDTTSYIFKKKVSFNFFSKKVVMHKCYEKSCFRVWKAISLVEIPGSWQVCECACTLFFKVFKNYK